MTSSIHQNNSNHRQKPIRFAKFMGVNEVDLQIVRGWFGWIHKSNLL